MKNYKTTICGLAMAAIQAIATYNGDKSWKGYALAAGLAAFGYLAKDFNVSGTPALPQDTPTTKQ